MISPNAGQPIAGNEVPTSIPAIAEDPNFEAAPKQTETQADFRSLALIERMAETSDRYDAISIMVRFVAHEFPTCNVRCGIGAASIRRFLDSKLGWLGPASDLFRQASEKWDEDTKLINAALGSDAAFDGDEMTAGSLSGSGQSVRLNIDDEVGLGRCVLWIEGADAVKQDRVWLRRALPTLRSLLWHRSGGFISQTLRHLSGYGYVARLYFALVVIAVVVLASWPVSYRVRCTSVVKPMHARVVAAPFESTLQTANVKLGDAVMAGDVLMTLDGRPLRLEMETIDAQLAQADKERDIALASGKVAEGQQAALKFRELSRKRDLIESRLSRLQVVSPIDGIVVNGDLERSIGMTMEMGQAVLEIAPLEQMVVELEIPESEVGFVEPKTPARVRLSGLRDLVIDQPIKSILPAAEIRDEQNVFIAKIEVQNSAGQLRPGMRGEAIAYGPIRPWLWSSIRDVLERVIWWIGY
ncbi:efflux RND transporter periplasmic adaptor subunit [Stieleria sp. JC731]|uniref:efflux RND transporter periplasmic adaptor subunit n=1 Tax=Pirellulaceae TaxID=2691357 RepID=UPI001E5523DE|nr:efflux RND transporter periplasmic adaptor subunit [Stieleria sp. JC731]MCC9603142.1 efflux RND transporter periplasmic adaptor subunit [Stieleria sp. JC731]